MASSIIEQQKNLTHEEYFALEKELDQKFEYVAGEIFAMTDGSINHALIGTNTIITLGNTFRNYPCTVLNSDAKLSIDEIDSFFYPDAMVLCEEGEIDKKYIQSPQIIVEVLSSSTEDYDHGKKFSYYRLIKSLQTYVMLHQDKVLAEVYQRSKDNSWILREYSNPEAVIPLGEGLQLAMEELYRQVKFE